MIKLSRRGVQIALGGLWLLDGALQLQPKMFSGRFSQQVLSSAAQGQPGLVQALIHFGQHLFLLHPALFNSLFALTQLGIGGLILWRRTVRSGLILSVLWGLTVWCFGEGFGGVFSGHTLLLMGAPGAVLIYVLLGLAVMPPRSTVKKSQRDVAFWLALVWLVFWVGGGIYQLLPGQNSTATLSAMVSGNASGAPGWLASVDNGTASFIQRFGSSSTSTGAAATSSTSMNDMSGMSNMSAPLPPASGYIFILLLASLQFIIGIGVIGSRTLRKLAISLGMVLSLGFWVVGQSLGSYYSGLATDPNSGPLFVLLGLAILSCTSLDQQLARLGNKLEQLMVGTNETGKPLIVEPSVEAD